MAQAGFQACTADTARARRDRLTSRIRQAFREVAFPVWQSESNMLALLRCLYSAGREDLAFARLLEGHADAVQLILRTGSPRDIDRLNTLLAHGATFGVWNADIPEAPLKSDRGCLSGGKAFASGAGLLSHALVTLKAGDRAQVQLLLLDLAETAPIIDRSWWRVAGMQASETHIVRWAGVPFEEKACRIGTAGDYEAEPWFSGGALRFVAAQAGGVAALFDGVRDHLVRTGRADHAQQRVRLAGLLRCSDLSAGAVRSAASRWFRRNEDAKLAEVAHARMAVAELAESALTLAQQSVGVSCLFEDHPLSRTITDLMVYLRQPAPDAQTARVGEAAAHGLLAPDL